MERINGYKHGTLYQIAAKSYMKSSNHWNFTDILQCYITGNVVQSYMIPEQLSAVTIATWFARRCVSPVIFSYHRTIGTSDMHLVFIHRPFAFPHQFAK